MAEKILVDSISELRPYIAYHLCNCGGEWKIVRQACISINDSPIGDEISVKCIDCGLTKNFIFEIDRNSPHYEANLKKWKAAGDSK